MRVSVGKPTLRVGQSRGGEKLLYINNLLRLKRSDRPSERKIVPCADHRADPFLALRPIGRRFCKRSDPPAFGKSQGSVDGVLVGVRICCVAVAVIDARNAQLLDQPSLPVTARAQGSGLAQRIADIVDIAELCETVRQSFEVRIPLIAPAAFAYLARKIGAELRPRGGIFPNVAERELLQCVVAQRRLGASTCGG